MGLLSKWLGIDARRNAEDEARKQAEATAKAAADAQALQEQVAATQQQYQQSMMNMQKESGVLTAANQELSTDTVSNVVAGGSADNADTSLLKKRKPVVGIAASLGINV